MSDGISASEPLYFFRVFTDGVERHQTDGIAFSSKAKVWEEASTSAGEILREMDGKMHVGMNWRMDVSDANGKLLYRLKFMTEEF